MSSGRHGRPKRMSLSIKNSGSSSQQESIKKPAKLEQLFCKNLQKQDTLYACSLSDEHGSIFLAEQDTSGHVLFSDIQTENQWNFYVEISENQSDYHYKFDKGWLQFVQAKGLTVGDSVTFYRQHATDLFFIDCLLKQPSVISQTLSLNQTTSTPSFDSPFLQYLSLFPEDHEIERDTLIQLGQSVGLFASAIASSFDVYQSEGYLYPSRYDEATGKLWYKVTDLVSKSIINSDQTHLKISLDDPINNNNSFNCENSAIEHVTVRSFPSNNVIQVLEKFTNLRTLWFLSNHRSRVTQIPYDFFTSLKLMQVLNLSSTKITELPSSIGHVRGLCYLDLSETLVKNLPETIGQLQELQTLKLKNCRRLITLPKATTRLEKLQCLHLGVHSYLQCMPLGFRFLTRLCTLSPFVIGYDELSSGISELKTLYGLNELRLTKLENVATSMEARGAELSTKVDLRSLELQWNSCGQKGSRVDEDVIECLQPHTDLKYFKLFGYKGSKFPSWFSDPSFANLMSITLLKCENLRVLPSLGRLPSLKLLTIDGLAGIRVIDYHFFRGNEHTDNIVAFPKLKYLGLISLLSLEEWKDVHKTDFPSLLKLELKDCPKLVTICSLSDMESLQHLEISNCPLLRSLPEGHLPASAEELLIEDCPLLESRCSRLEGEDWHKIKHVGKIWIDYENISYC